MKKKLALFLLLLSLFLKASTQNSLAPMYEITTDTAGAPIPDSCWQMLGDSHGDWTIDQVSQSPLSEKFHHSTDISDSSKDTYWIRLRLKNRMSHEARIYFRGSLCFYFDLYTKGDGSWWHQKTGPFVPFSQRDGLKNSYRIPVVIGAGQDLLVYQRLKFDPFNIPHRLVVLFGFTDLMIRNNYIVNEQDYFNNIKRGISFGICVLAAVFSFFFFLTAREWVYFHAAMLYLFTASFDFLEGVIGVFFREDQNRVSFYAQDFCIPLFLYFLASTVRLSLETKRLYPRWDKFLLVLSLLPSMSFIGQYFYAPLSKWGIILPILTFLSVIIISLTSVRKMNRTAKFLSTGCLLFAVFELVELLSTVLAFQLPGWWNKYELDITLLFFLWIIGSSSWMLFERYRQLQRRVLQDAFEKEQIAKQKEIERRQLVELQKVELERQVTERTSELNRSLEELRSTQAQLIQSEKMASLGELTAGIAHEIQNPLNFVNNFSDVNRELIDELKGERRKAEGERNREAENEILNDIGQNLEKISLHGKRADAIVKGMLQHSRISSGQKEGTHINVLCDEYLRLAYHGLRAKDKNFNAEIKTEFDASIGKINVIPQDIGRVLLNLFNNAFYALNEKKQQLDGTFEPILRISTREENGRLILKVKDNGNGIPPGIVNKIFQPFFTTKPTGQGTGLGLSLAYDIVKAHGGELKVETKEGEGSEFIILLPA